MRVLETGMTVIVALAFAALAGMAASSVVDAHWLTEIGKVAGKAGKAGELGKLGSLGKLGLGALEGAASYITKLPAQAKAIPLAAHATAEGHWSFINRQGELFTAGTVDEMGRVAQVLAPESGAGSKLAIYLSEDSVFQHSNTLKDLPAGADLHVVAGDNSYCLSRRASASGETLLAEVRPNIVVEIGERRLFEEAVFQLGRPLNRSNIRVLALEPSGPKTLSAVPSYDPATKNALVDAIDPGALPAALGKLRGQTVLMTGRVEADVLHFKPASGPESKISVTDIARAAEAADVHLILLQSSATRQPGGRNWLWQTIEVAGLDDALKRASFGDFLNAFGAGRGELIVSASPSIPGRIHLKAAPSGEASVPLTDQVGGWLNETAGELTGNVIVQGIQAFVPDRERQEELDARFIPGIPSWIQFTYLGSLIAGLIGWEFALAWWSRAWPPERREEYRGAVGYHAARGVRLLAFLLMFAPIVGIPAFVCTMVLQLWHALTAPMRWFRWLKGKTAILARTR